jgi:hypothetical protein
MPARWIAFGVLALLSSQEANAACVISGVRPTVPLPTMAAGQEFSFLATADCETLRFRVPGTRFAKIPKPGLDTGSRDRTYKVALTEREWNSLVDEGDTTFRWSIIGTTSAGVETRVTTTNELKDDGVTIDLSMADAKLVGHDLEFAGSSISGAGDVDGDGNDDLLVGAFGNDRGGHAAGAAYLVLGPVTGTLDLSLADATLVGEASSDQAGNFVAGAGDVDGDGHDDLFVGAPYNTDGASQAGAAYLVAGPVTGTLDLSLADAKLVGEERGDYAGSVSGAGDVDGDGHNDLLVGADNDEGGRSAGAVYLVLGPVTGTVDLSVADAKLVGDAGDAAGSSTTGCTVAGAGDVDADGNDDVLVGAPLNAEGGFNAGAAYVVLGPVTGTVDLSFADARVVGDGEFNVGFCVSGAGDVDADGHDDLLVSSSPNGNGRAYLLLGPVTGKVKTSRADAAFVGEENEHLGWGVSDAGDVDADGHDDLLIGAPGRDDEGLFAGAAYVVLGPVTGTIESSSVDITLVGEDDNDQAGSTVSGAGDVDGDGRDDVMIGASYHSAVYLLYGGGI